MSLAVLSLCEQRIRQTQAAVVGKTHINGTQLNPYMASTQSMTPLMLNGLANARQGKLLHIRPVGSSIPLTHFQSNLSIYDLSKTLIRMVTGQSTLLVDGSNLIVVHDQYLQMDDLFLLQNAVSNGRAQLCVIPFGDKQQNFRVEVTIFHSLEQLWPFDIHLDMRCVEDREVMTFLAETAVRNIWLCIGTHQAGIQMIVGFQQMYLPPLDLQSQVLITS